MSEDESIPKDDSSYKESSDGDEMPKDDSSYNESSEDIIDSLGHLSSTNRKKRKKRGKIAIASSSSDSSEEKNYDSLARKGRVNRRNRMVIDSSSSDSSKGGLVRRFSIRKPENVGSSSNDSSLVHSSMCKRSSKRLKVASSSSDSSEEINYYSSARRKARKCAKNASQLMKKMFENNNRTTRDGFVIKREKRKSCVGNDDLILEYDTDEPEKNELQKLRVENEKDEDYSEEIDTDNFIANSEEDDEYVENSPSSEDGEKCSSPEDDESSIMQKLGDDDNESNSSSSLYETGSEESIKINKRRRSRKCTSKFDSITNEELPSVHVCWESSDGSSKQCFLLNTLRRIGLCSPKKALLQPPHFRDLMEESLKNQIRSKFGSDALCINPSLVDNKDDNVFQDHLRRYFHGAMGNIGDLYVCPLCFCEAHRRLLLSKNYNEYKDDEASDKYFWVSHKFQYDPLTVLLEIDPDLEMPSKFCFRTLKNVREHIREQHGQDLSCLQNNSLFHRFQIRQGDGLLQNYLESYHGRFVTQQDFYNYWVNCGMNSEFSYLCSKVDSITDGSSPSSTALFRQNQNKVWQILSAPYAKHHQSDEEFIVDDESVGDSQKFHHQRFNHILFEQNKETPEEAMIKELRRRRKDGDILTISSEASSFMSSDSDEQSNTSHVEKNAHLEQMLLLSIEEDILKSFNSKGRKTISESTDKEVRHSKVGKRQRIIESEEEGEDKDEEEVQQSKVEKKRRIIETEEEDKDEEELQHSKVEKMRRIIESEEGEEEEDKEQGDTCSRMADILPNSKVQTFIETEIFLPCISQSPNDSPNIKKNSTMALDGVKKTRKSVSLVEDLEYADQITSQIYFP